MNNTELAAIEVYSQLASWIAYREGGESYLLSANADQWAEQSTATGLYRDILATAYPSGPRWLLTCALRIYGLQFNLSLRDAYHDCRKRTTRDAMYGCGGRPICAAIVNLAAAIA